MATLILSIHIIACILLILIVLLQTGKGADMGATFGSASGQAFFGGSGPATALSKITTVVAIIFMLTSLTMAYTSGHKSSNSIMSQVKTSVESQETQKNDDTSGKMPIEDITNKDKSTTETK